MILPILFAGVVGFSHAFELDHLLAVSSIVTRRNSVNKALKDGVYWGLGHSSTILIIGMAMLVAKIAVAAEVFHYLEACVGLMLIALGMNRIWKSWKPRIVHAHPHAHPHDVNHGHQLAYGVGLVHGLAGSGALVLVVMTELKSPWEGILYLLIFGLGSIAGMLLASSIFSLPFSMKVAANPWIYKGLTMLSALLCLAFGAKIIFENLIQA